MNADPELECSPALPCVADLVSEFQRCAPEAGFWNRVDDNERTRFAVWENQSPDGRKHDASGFEAKPWDGASDLRVYVADDIVNEEVAVCSMAFWRALVRTQGVNPDDAGAAASITRLLDWLVRGRLAASLLREVELSAQYQRTYGWTAVHVTWVRELGLRHQAVTLEELVRLSPGMAALVLDPAREEEALDLLEAAWLRWVAERMSEAGIEEPPAVSRPTLRRALRGLRSQGKASLPVPYVVRSEPCLEALRPWVDVFVPDEIGDVQRGRVFVRQWLREEEVRARVLTDGWDPAWVDQAVKTRGSQSVWTRNEVAGAGAAWSVRTTQDSPWIEVLTCYSRRIDPSGVPGIYVTVFSPHFTAAAENPQRELVARHGLLDYQHGQVPLVLGVREWICRSITASRGVPEVAAPLQRLTKVMQDSLIDRTTLTTLPPRIVPSRLMDDDQEFGPAATIPILRGEEPRFMQVPAHDGVAESILRFTRERVDQEFGRLSASVPPARVQARQQHMVNGFLGMWSEAFKQVLALVMQYLSPREFQRVTGVEKPPMSPEEIAGSYDLILTVDVRELDVDFAVKQLQAVSQFVLPEDAAGVVDRSKLVRAKLQAINPLLARDLVSDRAGAQQKLFRDVSAEVASMFLGNPPNLVENDPTAAMQLQFAAQIVQANPNYQAALQQGGRFAEMLQVWGKNRMQSKVQQENKVVGRLGVQAPK